MREGDHEVVFDKGDIEALAVVGHKQIVIEDVVLEISQVRAPESQILSSVRIPTPGIWQNVLVSMSLSSVVRGQGRPYLIGVKRIDADPVIGYSEDPASYVAQRDRRRLDAVGLARRSR